MIQLQLAPGDDQAPDLDLTPGPAEGEARQVVAALLEGVDADARALDHHAREDEAAVEQRGQRRRHREARHFQEGLGLRSRSADAQVA